MIAVAILAASQAPVTQEIARYPVKANITGDVGNMSVGVSVDADEINFGDLPAEAVQAEKRVTIANGNARPMTVRLRTTGNISTHLSVNATELRIPPGEEQEVTLRLTTTDTTNTGVYTGTLIAEKQLPFWRLIIL